MSRQSQLARDDSGAVAILVAAFALVMFGLAAFVVDLAVEKGMRRDAQSAADASALAAANALYSAGSTPDFTAAVAAVKSYASFNLGVSDAEWASCSATSPLPYTPVGTSSCISFDSSTSPSNVRVVIPPRKSPSLFGGVFGYRGAWVDALAQAQVASSTQTPCAFCVLGEGTHDAQNGNIAVSNGDTWINGNITFGPQGGVATTTGGTYVEAPTVNRPANVTGNPVTYSAGAVQDPLSFLTLPPSTTGLVVRSNPCTDGPGFYGAQNLNGNGTCTLAPGLYVFTDPLTLGGSEKLSGTGVTLYFTCGVAGTIGSCGSDAQPGSLQASNALNLSAPTSGALKGLVIAYDRSNTGTITFQGSIASSLVTGTVYAPAATMVVQGNACGTTFKSLVVIGDFSGTGNPSCVTDLYDPALQVQLQPTPNGLVL